MPRLDRLPEAARNRFLTYPWQDNESAPYVPLPRHLSDCTLALVTTAGVHLRDDRPFVGGDPGCRAFPSGSSFGDLLQSHASIGFDRTYMQQDWNVVVPLDRLRELVDRHEIGRLAGTCYSFMGAQTGANQRQQENAHEVGRRLRADGVDAVLLTPT